jgi:hypothetical protein
MLICIEEKPEETKKENTIYTPFDGSIHVNGK